MRGPEYYNVMGLEKFMKDPKNHQGGVVFPKVSFEYDSVNYDFAEDYVHEF